MKSPVQERDLAEMIMMQCFNLIPTNPIICPKQIRIVIHSCRIISKYLSLVSHPSFKKNNNTFFFLVSTHTNPPTLLPYSYSTMGFFPFTPHWVEQ